MHDEAGAVLFVTRIERAAVGAADAMLDGWHAQAHGTTVDSPSPRHQRRDQHAAIKQIEMERELQFMIVISFAYHAFETSDIASR